MTPLAHVETERRGDLAVARIAGEVDGSNVEEIGAQLRGLMTNRSHELIVDLSGTTYLDSAGLNLLFALGHELAAHQQVLRLVVDERTPIVRVVRIVSLNEAYPTYPTLDAALAAVGERGE